MRSRGVLDQLLDDASFAPRGTDPLREALVQIAARYGEIVTQCLNATADLHLKAFAELLGGQARPATAARVHVSFRPAAGAASPVAGAASQPVKVPMYTRLAAQAGGSGEPPIFETLADLELVRAEAVSALFVDAGHRRIADVGAIFSEAGFAGDVSNLARASDLCTSHRPARGIQRARIAASESADRCAGRRLARPVFAT